MSAFSEIVEAIAGLAQAAAGVSVTIGALPADNAVCIAPASGAPSSTFLDKGMAYQWTLVCNAKNVDQKAAQEVLNAVHLALTQTKTYPTGDAWQITDIGTVAAPAYIGREQNSQWLYGSSLRVKFFLRS